MPVPGSKQPFTQIGAALGGSGLRVPSSRHANRIISANFGICKRCATLPFCYILEYHCAQEWHPSMGAMENKNSKNLKEVKNAVQIF